VKKEWESVKSEYEKYVLIVPVDEVSKAMVAKEFEGLCNRVNEAYSNYLNELEFQIRRRDNQVRNLTF
jgi:hypothetical protein